MGKKNPCKNAFGTGRACLFQRRFYVLYRKCEEAPAKFRRKGETAAELGKGLSPWMHDVRQRPRRKWFALQGHSPGSWKAVRHAYRARFPAQSAARLFALPGISGETRRLQEWESRKGINPFLNGKCEEAPAKFRRKGETAAELGKGLSPWMHDVRQRPRRKWFALQGHSPGSWKAVRHAYRARFPAQSAARLFALPGISGETRHLQEWGLSRRRAKQFESCVRTSLNPLMGTVILWIANFQCHTVHHGALAADDRQLLLFRKADRFAFV